MSDSEEERKPSKRCRYREPPPPFLPDKSYKGWKNHVEIWAFNYDCPPEDQAPIVFSHCFRRHPIAERSLQNFTLKDLNKADGLTNLFAKLDSVFLEEAMNEKWTDFLKVFNFERNERCSMADFIIEFEQNRKR